MDEQTVLDPKMEKAAYLLGTTSDSVEEIAVYAGCTAMAIMDWLADPDFNLRVTHFQTARLAEAKRMPYARKADRIESYSKEMQRLDLIISARKRYFNEKGETDETSITGGTSGVVVHKMRAIGLGDL